MADLKVIVEPKGDEFNIAVTVPASRYGGHNFGALAKTLLVLRSVVPDAFDPKPLVEHHAAEAPMPPAVAELLTRSEHDDTPEVSLNFDTGAAA
jgi:hypothetical protein